MKPLRIKQFTIGETNRIPQIVASIRKESISRTDRVSKAVSDILLRVQKEGSEALLELVNRFDGSEFGNESELIVKTSEIEEAYSMLNQEDIKALRESYLQVKWLARKQMQRFEERRILSPLGFEIEERYAPLSRVGGYIPGGQASYPSTVAMICAPARAAGVKEIIIATPAQGGKINPSVLVAADICGADVIIKAGGAHAIGALAFGTKLAKGVDLICGPGNEYVTEAKRQIQSRGIANIDSLAGPTELLVIADSLADSKLVYEDIVSQAEHGNRTLCGVVTDSGKIINDILQFFKEISNRPRYTSISQSLIFIVKATSMKSAFEFAEAFAPEHLELMTKYKSQRRVSSAGLVLLGRFTPCSATDYIVGTNHILPTAGSASKRAGLSVETFLKRVTTIRGTKKSLERSAEYISRLSKLEGLPNHGLAATARLGRKN